MNKEQKELVTSINELEAKLKKLNRQFKKEIEEANQTKVDIFNRREILRSEYLKLKEVTEKAKVTEKPNES